MPASSAIVAGNVTQTALVFLERHGARIEEVRGLTFIELPETADIATPERGCEGPRQYGITFSGELLASDEEIYVVVEPECLCYETRVFTLLR